MGRNHASVSHTIVVDSTKRVCKCKQSVRCIEISDPHFVFMFRDSLMLGQFKLATCLRQREEPFYI